MDEKICKLFLPLLEKLYNQEPAGEPFRKPVDVVKYNCTNYYDFIKHPIDLSTIRDRLTGLKYRDAWRFVADIQLMFSNAYLFNRKGTPVYEWTNKLNKIWIAELTPIMQRLNYCCGTLHKFGPQLLFCHGSTPDKYCQIPIGSKYKCYEDQYSYCLACFNRIESEQITIQVKQSQEFVNKSDFVDCTNDHWQYESFIQCTRCTRRVHRICELYPDEEDSQCLQHEEIEEEQKHFDQPDATQSSSLSTTSASQSSSTVATTTTKTKTKSTTTTTTSTSSSQQSSTSTSSSKTKSVDDKREDIAQGSSESEFVCNHCYRKEKIGFDLRHRKYSARRLPHTRMSRYIEAKVNEHIRANSPSAGEVTIRVLTAHRDTIPVKKEMRDYVRKCREKMGLQQQHANAKDYPDEFSYTNRAIFAWQEIDSVDVCVFGMHVQEYGEDNPEPNRQVVYLSYLDSVHYFRPKQVRTAVYHEILLSYFKYVKQLGFRKVFIWVCPSRKGDDYIFYRHPSDQKMPNQKRLLDWYIKMLDKGILAGIIEKHQNINQYATSENWTSVLDMPYLSGDYWPGEFERLISHMNESQREYEMKQQNDNRDDPDISDIFERDKIDYGYPPPAITHYQHQNHYQNNISPPTTTTTLVCPPSLKPIPPLLSICCSPENDSFNEFSKQFDPFTPDSMRSESDQPLDLSTNVSKSSYNTSPESYVDDDGMSVLSYKSNSRRKRRRPSASSSYIKKRGRTSSQIVPYGGDSIYKPEAMLSPEEEMFKSLERSLHRQREGFIVAHLSDCDCSPHFVETQLRKKEPTFTCDLMKGREPFLLLSRQKFYEFSTLRRAKYSSLAMVKHLGEYLALDQIEENAENHSFSKLSVEPPTPPLTWAPSTNTAKSNNNNNNNNNGAINEENAENHTLSALVKPVTPPPSHQHHPANNSNNNTARNNDGATMLDIDAILVENFIRSAEVTYDLDYDQMKNESRRILAHYWSCPSKETCHRCKFVVLSCSFMSRWMQNSKWLHLVK